METFFRVFIPETASAEKIYKPLQNNFYLVEPSVSVQGGPARNNNEVKAIVVEVTKRSDREDLLYFDHEVTPGDFGEELSISVINEFEMGGKARYVTVFGEKSMERKLRGKEYGMLPHLMERVHTFGSGRIYRARYPVSEDYLDNGRMFVVGTRLNATDGEIKLIAKLKDYGNRFGISKETLLGEFKVAEDSKISG